MKLQAASKKEISRIAVGTLACDVIMIAGLFLLSQFGIGKFDGRDVQRFFVRVVNAE